MKNKSALWAIITLVAVVVIGGAVYLGNPATQKGTFMLSPPSRPAASCGTSWTKVYGGTQSNGSITTSLATNHQALQTLMDNGCSFKFVLDLQRAGESYIENGLSFECAYVQTSPAVDFQCTGSLDSNQYAPSAGLSFVGVGLAPSVTLGGAYSSYISSADSVIISLFAKK